MWWQGRDKNCSQRRPFLQPPRPARSLLEKCLTVPRPTRHSQLGTGIASRKPSVSARVNLRHTATPVTRTLWHGQWLTSLSVWVLGPLGKAATASVIYPSGAPQPSADLRVKACVDKGASEWRSRGTHSSRDTVCGGSGMSKKAAPL